ncbi:MAG: fumarylacetoacetase [Bacteroidales bacterium]|nr:fumarylacetoacetase [Bacteroidales bacterium]MCF6341513.1 fumarylacetoacetase [Bacteroidales bacterium]
MINANNPALSSWIPVPPDSDFPIQNIPFGIAKPQGKTPRPVTRVGETVIDLSVLADNGFFDELDIDNYGVFYAPVLNDFIALGKPLTNAVRQRLSDLFNKDNQELHSNTEACKHAVLPVKGVEMMMPVEVGDYTDFYSSIEHATNIGTMIRDPKNALSPNWKHLPVGYHGRASSIVVSGTGIHRPKGQRKPPGSDVPEFGPTRLFDFELEMAFITGKGTKLGARITTEKAEEHIFGMLLFNDLSARDIQTWEYVPLGPFLGKNFGSVVSPWIVTLEALEPFRVAGPLQEPKVLPYLQFTGNRNFDIQLEVGIQPEGCEETTVCKSNYKYLYWNISQHLAHHTVNGCNINVGDMYASGTISGPTAGSYGSMMELSWRGTKPLKLKEGGERKFIEDNDTIVMRAHALKNNVRIGFGEVVTRVLPAIK